MKKKEQICFPKEVRELKNNRTGETKTFTLRAYEAGDEAGMLACIRDEYGDSYFKRDFYDVKKLREKALSDAYVFFVAECEGQIAGMELLALFCTEGDDYIEPASQIFHRKVRGYGLASALVDYTFALARELEPSALFVHAVTFHDITQHVCGAQGMLPTGFRLGSFLTSGMKNSYPKGNCPKYSEGIMILPLQKKQAGVVYVPEELAAVVGDCYDRLGMTYTLSSVRAAYRSAACSLTAVTDAAQRMVCVRVHSHGETLVHEVQQLLCAHTEPYWVYQIALPANDGQLLTAYEQLKALGFFFTGVKAACADTEQIYMQWCGDLALCMEDYVLTDAFARMRDRIQYFYDRRKVE